MHFLGNKAQIQITAKCGACFLIPSSYNDADVLSLFAACLSFSADSLLLYPLPPFLIPSLLKGEAVLIASCVLKADFVLWTSEPGTQ